MAVIPTVRFIHQNRTSLVQWPQAALRQKLPLLKWAEMAALPCRFDEILLATSAAQTAQALPIEPAIGEERPLEAPSPSERTK